MMRELLLGSRTNLRLELISIACCAVVFGAVELLWLHDVGVWGLAYFLALMTGVTLLRHLYWHYRPPKVPPVTRYTNPRYNKDTLDK